MKYYTLIVVYFLLLSCENKQELQVLSELPKELKEVSGIELVKNSDLIWMHNDSGNKNYIYGVTPKGKVKRVVKVEAKNHDWEDITSDEQGNLYIADFGNNKNERKNLVILKVKNSDLLTKNTVEVEKIKFSYPNQHKFPPKKEKRFFDAEGIFYANGNLYIFTKSRVKNAYGKTSLYKIPAEKGNYVASYISSYIGCKKPECRITAADISSDKKTVALLTSKTVLFFSDFKEDDFLSGNVTEVSLGFKSQKEAICFDGNKKLYITDEKSQGKGGKLYRCKINAQ